MLESISPHFDVNLYIFYFQTIIFVAMMFRTIVNNIIRVSCLEIRVGNLRC